MFRTIRKLLVLASFSVMTVTGCAGGSNEAPILDQPSFDVAPSPFDDHDGNTNSCALWSDPLCPSTPIVVPGPQPSDW